MTMQFHWPGFDSLGRLSAEETAELASRMADLTRSGLPLSDGLRALAGELSGRRLRRVLLALADQLDSGVDLTVAIESQSGRLPSCLRGLVLAGLRSGRLAETLEEYVDLQRSQSDLRHRLWLGLAYPYILFIFLALLAIVGRVYFVRPITELYRDFGVGLPTITVFTLQTSWAAVWGLTFFVGAFSLIPMLLAVSPSMRRVWPLLHRLPILGPLLQWTHLSQFARLMAMLLEQQVPLPDALRLAAAGLRDPDLAYGCGRVADDVDKGRVLYESMAARRQFPLSLIPVVEWGQRNAVLSDAFRAAADMFEGRVRSQGSLLEAIVLPFVFLVVTGLVGMFAISLLLPLISLIETLSGGYGPGAGAVPGTDVLGSIAIFAPLLLGAAVLASHRLISGRRDKLREDAVNLTLMLTGWVLVVVGVTGSFSNAFVAMSIPWWIIALVITIETVLRCWRSQQYALLWLLTVSAERFMPLAPAIEAFAREQGGFFGRRAMRLADMLRSGVAFPDAVARCRRVLPPRTLGMVRVGHQAGALASALRDAATAAGQYHSLWASLIGKLSYVVTVPFFALATVSFAMFWIVPKFGKMFHEFGIELPAMCQWLINISNFAADYWYLSFPFWLAAAALLVHAVMRRYGWTQRYLPGTAWFWRRLDAANVMDSLALVAQQQRPMLDGISELARSYQMPNIRRRLARAADDVAAGADWAESLRRRGLIGRADLAILQAAQRVGNLAWALQEMAQSNRRRFAYRVQAILQTAFPAVVVLFGVIVAFIAMALFLPLITMIQTYATS